MFRNVTRVKQQLSREDCIRLLQQQPRGVLSLIGDDGYPYGLPIDHWYNPDDGQIYFHSGKQGHKIDAIRRDPKVSFCVYEKGVPDEEGWFLYVRSVVIFGRMRVIEDREETLLRVRRLGLKYYPDAQSVEAEIDKDGHRVTCLELTPEHMTGKRVHEQ